MARKRTRKRICVGCGKPSGNTTQYCKPCRAKETARVRETLDQIRKR